MKNFIDVGSPFASARIGEGEVFVSELDESDGSIALYKPEIAASLAEADQYIAKVEEMLKHKEAEIMEV